MKKTLLLCALLFIGAGCIQQTGGLERDVDIIVQDIRTVPVDSVIPEGEEIDWETELADVELIDETSCLPEGRADFCAGLNSYECGLHADICKSVYGADNPGELGESFQTCEAYSCREIAAYNTRKALCLESNAQWLEDTLDPYGGRCVCVAPDFQDMNELKSCLDDINTCTATEWKDYQEYTKKATACTTKYDDYRAGECMSEIAEQIDFDARHESCVEDACPTEKLEEWAEQYPDYTYSYYTGSCILLEEYDHLTDTYWLYLNGLEEYIPPTDEEETSETFIHKAGPGLERSVSDF